MNNLIKSIFIIFILVVVSQQRSIEQEKTPFEFDDVFSGRYISKSWNGTWISDTAFIYRSNEGHYMKFDIVSRQSELFLDNNVLAPFVGATLSSISNDVSYVLIKYNESTVSQHSTIASYAIYELKTNTFYDLVKESQLVVLAPQGSGLAYVKENNIFYIDDYKNPEPLSVTTSGDEENIYCGLPDWVYKEELFGSEHMLWFSQDASRFVYVVLNDTEVRNFYYSIYGEPGAIKNQYPDQEAMKYPKVNTPNPKVKLYSYEIPTGIITEFKLPTQIGNTENVTLFGVTWISRGELAITTANRVQNESFINRCFINGTCKLENIRKEPEGWIERSLPLYNYDGYKRLQILPQPVENDRYDSLVSTNLYINESTRLTSGKQSIINVNYWDQINGIIYYTATVSDTPSQVHVYATNEWSGETECLTCSMTVDGIPCTYAEAYFSKAATYITKQCIGPTPRLVEIQNLRDLEDTYVWEDNGELRAALALKLTPIVKNILVPINDNYTARIRLYLPPNLDENKNKKYPVIVDTYAGPGFNQIKDTYSIDFLHYLVTKREYIYVFIDGRGSGKDGYNKLYQIYRKLATVEVEDQIYVTKYLQESLSYFDATRTVIWGWSYGGFCSSWALAKDTNRVFSSALAVAPVTNFIYYDTIYTERYMGLPTPEDNQLGYNHTDLTTAVGAFKARNYFIIQGTGDDNVHYQNAMLLIKALEKADIEFMQISYPDEGHDLGGVFPHLYHSIDNYWERLFSVNMTFNSV